MNLLGIETSTRVGTLAIVEEGKVLCEEIISENLRHAGRFEEKLDRLFLAARRNPSGLDAIAVGLGPGSFTGIRVGLAIGKAISYALAKPLIGVGSLDVLAHQTTSTCETLCPMIPGEPGEVYAALYRRGSAGLEKTACDFWARVTELPSVAERAGFFFGPALEREAEALRALFRAERLDSGVLFPRAGMLGILAQSRIWGVGPPHVAPRYVKAPTLRRS